MILTIHSYWAYLVLLVLILAAVNAIIGATSNKEFQSKDLRISLFTLIFSHIQLLIGLATFFFSEKLAAMKEIGMGETMKNPELRKLIVEHPFTMLIAIILITVGWSKHKKQETDKGKFKSIAIFYTIALALVLYMIPWNQWL